MPEPEIDRTDCKILALLQEEARLPNVELAQSVGLSPSPCLRRVRLLEEGGVIRRYVTLLDPAKVGLPVSVFVQITLERQVETALQGFEEAVGKHPEVMECYLMTGRRRLSAARGRARSRELSAIPAGQPDAHPGRRQHQIELRPEAGRLSHRPAAQPHRDGALRPCGRYFEARPCRPRTSDEVSIASRYPRARPPIGSASTESVETTHAKSATP